MDEMVQQQQQMQATPVQPATVQLPPPQRPLSPPPAMFYPPPAVTAPPLWQKRSDGITLVAGYHFVVAALFLLGAVIMMLPTAILGIISVVEPAPDAVLPMFIVGFIAVVTLLLSLLYLAVGYGLWTLKQWARVAAMALAMVSLFGVPIGTVTGGLTLWYLMQPQVAARFETV